MQSSRHGQLVTDICTKVIDNLNKPFYYDNWDYYLLPYPLPATIDSEIHSALDGLELSPMQQRIIDQLNDQELETLINKTAGDLKLNEKSNLFTGQDIEGSGLCKLYYDNLHIKKSRVVGIKFLQILDFNPRCSKIFGSQILDATQNHLKGRVTEGNGFKSREEIIVSLYCQEIARLGAFNDQLGLAYEIKNNKSSAVTRMKTPHDWSRFFLKPQVNSTGYLAYEDVLFKSMLVSNIIHAAFENKLPIEIFQLLTTYLSEQDKTPLFCLNRKANETKQTAMLDYQNTFKR